MEFDRLFQEALKDAQQRLGASSKDGWRAAIDAWVGFYRAVDWREPWLRVLLVAHACLFIVIWLTREDERTQGVLFCACAVIVFMAERINALAAAQWEAFATQNYFDPSGRFTSVVLSTPLVVATLIILINLLLIMTSMMVEVAKRRKDVGIKKTQ
jgi:hypothetical protein